jgi:D-alanyl-lipoteichoic acid acyltransferase DltB (MBOAT superfamily)
MLFNSFEFLVFLPVVWVLYWYGLSRNLKGQNILLLIASYVFYGWWSWKFLILLGLNTALDYLYGFGVATANRRRARVFLWLSVINNLGILAVFKYFDFFSAEFARLLNGIGWRADPILLDLALPVGISFYTFHGMSYVFDVYRGRLAPIRDVVDYAVFVAFFPLLVAGPIERAAHLLPQIRGSRRLAADRMVSGLRLILWGMFKKVVVADNLAVVADTAFNQYQSQTWLMLATGAVAFAFQIYGDFSGYSDIALGTARLFGFELLSNFRFPYFSRDIAEFWRRWHISLSSWFRDYLYIPLGGSRNGKAKAVRNTFIIFLVSGFWHGAGWNYILWGGLHALFFLPLLLSGSNRAHSGPVVAQDGALPSLPELGRMIRTFLLVTFAWVFFRAPDLEHATGFLRRMGHGLLRKPLAPTPFLPILLTLSLSGILLLADWWLRRDERELRPPTKLRLLCYAVLLASIILFFGQSESFIYFQF